MSGVRSMRVAAALAVLLAVVAAALGAAARYQPLRQAGELQAGAGMQLVTVEEFEESGAHILRYSDGDYVTYAFGLHNAGPVGVTVTSLDLPGQRERLLLQPVAAGLASRASAEAVDMEPFEPFALAAGEQRKIVIQARFDNCEYYTERALEIVDHHVVGFRVGGISRTAEVVLDRPLVVRSPTIRRCDERTLDRSEHRRTDP